MTEPVRFVVESGVGCVTLAAPARGNALDDDALDGLHTALLRATDDPACRVVLLAAEGSDFCRGLDLAAAFAGDDRPEAAALQRFLDCLTLIRRCPRPVVARVEGPVSGGGVGLVAACDLVLATEQAVFMLPEVITGLIPALVAPFLLRRLTPARLGYLALSTRGIAGAEAREYGLIDEAVTDGMDRAVERQLRRLFRSSPAALAETKRYLDRLGAPDSADALAMARETALAWMGRPEVADEVRTFAEGGLPSWFTRYERGRDAVR